MFDRSNQHNRHHHQFGGPGARGRGHGRGMGAGRPHHGEVEQFEGEYDHRGPGGQRGRARRGEARFLLLDVLKDGPLHGYEIIRLLQERSGGAYAPSPGTVYPTLQHLEDVGLVTVAQDESRKVYQLTDLGKAELAEHADEIAIFWKQFSQPAVSSACGAEAAFLKHETEDLLRALWFGAERLMNSDNADGLKSLRQTIERCKTEVRAIITQGQETTTPNRDSETI